jgi:hypothetical protein
MYFELGFSNATSVTQTVAHMLCACVCVGKAWRCDVYIVCHVVFQTDGAAPVLVACQNGHEECVRALLGAGAAVNHQATVCCARSMARRCGGTVYGDVLEPALMHV